MDNDQLLDFLSFGYFGCTYSKIQLLIKEKKLREIAEICASRAYVDLARTLTYQKATLGESDKQKTEAEKDETSSFKEKICACLGERISAFFYKHKSDNVLSQEEFDKWHDNVCVCITACGESSDALACRQPEKQENKKFYYGQAQKWLNMTLKYMILLNVEEVCSVRDLLHVPIDQYILKAAAEKDNKGKYAIKKEIVPAIHSGESKASVRKYFKEGKTQPWSQLNQKDYIELQKDLRREIYDAKKVKTNNWIDIICPLDWEAIAWIEQAKLKQTKQEKEKMKA